MDNTTQDGLAMAMIAYSGEGRSLAFQALNTAKKALFEDVCSLLKQSDEALMLAHQAQTTLLVEEARGNKSLMNILLVHAQDHLMTSMLANEIIKEIIELYKERGKKI